MSDAAPISFVPVVTSTTIFGGSVLVDWDTVQGADGYDVEVLDGQGDPLDPPPSIVWGEDGSSAVISGPAVATGVVLRVRVRSTSSYSAPVEIPVTLLAPPAAPTLSAAADQVQATWSAVPGAQAYEVEVLDADGLALHPQPPTTVTGTSASIDASGLPTGGAFGVRVRAQAGTSTSDWGAAGTVRVHRVPPPAITSALYRGGAIAFTWSAVPGATRYLVQVLDATGARLDPQPAVAGSNESASVSGVAIAGGARVQIQVGVEVTGQGSAWSDPLPIDLVDLAASAPTVTVQPDGAEVRWDAVTGATGYRVQLLDAQGSPIPEQPATEVDQPAARIPGDGLRAGVAYAVQVTAVAPQCEGPPSAPVSFTRVVLGAPAGLTATYHAAERRAVLSWDAVEGASGYFVRLLSEGAPETSETSTLGTTASVPVPGGGGAQVAQVRAARPDAEGEWASVDVTVVDLRAPSGIALAVDGDGITAQWQAVDGAGGYEVRVLDAEAEPWQPAPDVTVDGTGAVISADGLDAGDYFEVRIRATAPGAVGPWSAPAFLRTDQPAAPPAVQAVYRSAARQVRVTWNPAAGAESYGLRIVDGAGR
ncbi:MAG TPA: fibronectin type III domain-containing protein, partial [Longimicrobiaceae bacterium]|nr:fibronectin type III domain-containing protein [Longimicrobiaceae bacterium]